jgi:ABC-type sugar transport system ATPase subunit
MDVFNNLAFGLRSPGVSRQEIERRVTAVAAKLGTDGGVIDWRGNCFPNSHQ